VGDWVNLKKEFRLKHHFLLKVIAIRNEQLIVKWGNGESSINPFFYELATEKEIKTHKLENLFQNKQLIK
jgi:hypothetical protein